jgi:hypothetical protein
VGIGETTVVIVVVGVTVKLIVLTRVVVDTFAVTITGGKGSGFFK